MLRPFICPTSFFISILAISFPFDRFSLIFNPSSKLILIAGILIISPVTEAVPVNRIPPAGRLNKIIPFAPYFSAKAVFSERCRFSISFGVPSNKPSAAKTIFPVTLSPIFL